MGRMTKARLEWPFDNEPETVRELAKGKMRELEELLNNDVVSAIQYAQRLQKEGMEEQESYYLASELMLTPASPWESPAMGDNPPEPLPWEERDRIYKRLDALEEALERLDRMQNRIT